MDTDNGYNLVRFRGNGGDWEMPYPMAAIAADNALIDTIARGGQPRGELERLLLQWRDSVHAEPVSELVDLDTAVRVVALAQRRRWATRSALIGAGIAWVLVVAGVLVLLAISEGWL